MHAALSFLPFSLRFSRALSFLPPPPPSHTGRHARTCVLSTRKSYVYHSIRQPFQPTLSLPIIRSPDDFTLVLAIRNVHLWDKGVVIDKKFEQIKAIHRCKFFFRF